MIMILKSRQIKANALVIEVGGIAEVRDIHFKLDKIGESYSMDYKNEEDAAD